MTGQAIASGEQFVAALVQDEQGMRRLDFTPAAWRDLPPDQRVDWIAHWHTTMPAPEQGRRKLLADDDVLLAWFDRLADTDDDEQLAFRFVLGLWLMRRRKLVFAGSDTGEDGRDVWTLTRKGGDPATLIDPKLDEDRLQAVGDQLHHVLAAGVDEDAVEP